MKFTMAFEQRDGRLHATLTTGDRVYERMVSVSLEKSVLALTDYLEHASNDHWRDKRAQHVTFAARVATARELIDRDGVVTTLSLSTECDLEREHANTLLRKMRKLGLLTALPRKSNGAIEYVRAAVVQPEAE